MGSGHFSAELQGSFEPARPPNRRQVRAGPVKNPRPVWLQYLINALAGRSEKENTGSSRSLLCRSTEEKSATKMFLLIEHWPDE